MQPKKGDMLSQAFARFKDASLRPQGRDDLGEVRQDLNIPEGGGSTTFNFSDSLKSIMGIPKVGSPSDLAVDAIVSGTGHMINKTASSIFDIPNADTSEKQMMAQDLHIQEMNARSGNKTGLEVVNDQYNNQVQEASNLSPEEMTSPSETTTQQLQKDMDTVGRGTGASDVAGTLTSLQEASPGGFEDIANALKEITGYSGPINDAAKRSQEMINTVMSQGTGRINEVNAGETERWRQLQAKLAGGAGLSSGDKMGFALMSLVPILAKLINKRARVDLAYQNLGQAYNQAQANSKSEHAELLKEYDMISDNVRAGGIQLNQAASAQIQADMAVANSQQKSAMEIYNMSNDPKRNEQFIANIRNREGLPDVSDIKPAEQEKIGTQILVKDKLSKMEKLEAQIFEKVKNGTISPMQMDAVLQYSTADGWISLSNLPKHWQKGLMQSAPELYEYQSVYNEVIQLAIKKKSGGAFSEDELSMTKTYNGLLGYTTPELANSMQGVRRRAFNRELLGLTPEGRARARVDYITSQIGYKDLQKSVRSRGGTINFNTGTVINVQVNTPEGPKLYMGSVEDYIELMKQQDPQTFGHIKTVLTFEE